MRQVFSDMPYTSDSGTPMARNQLKRSGGMGAAPVTATSRSSSPSSTRTGLNATSSKKAYVASSSAVAVPQERFRAMGRATSTASSN